MWLYGVGATKEQRLRCTFVFQVIELSPEREMQNMMETQISTKTHKSTIQMETIGSKEKDANEEEQNKQRIADFKQLGKKHEEFDEIEKP